MAGGGLMARCANSRGGEAAGGQARVSSHGRGGKAVSQAAR